MMSDVIFSARRPLDARARSLAPGNFIDLPQGKVHYEQTGPVDGAPMVLVHGLSVPGFVWDPVFEPLGRLDFRVTRFDLFGRGYSDRPQGAYDADFFAKQVTGVLDALDIRTPIHLAGVSMGCPISGSFTLNHPDRVKTLTLINAAGMMPEPNVRQRILLSRGVMEIYLHFLGTRMAIAGLKDDFYAMSPPTDYIEKVRRHLSFKGFNQALLSTLRSGILWQMEPMYRTLGSAKCRTMLIWGLEDNVVPFDSCERLRQMLPHAHYCPVPKAGHIPQYECPEQVLKAFASFLA